MLFFTEHISGSYTPHQLALRTCTWHSHVIDVQVLVFHQNVDPCTGGSDEIHNGLLLATSNILA